MPYLLIRTNQALDSAQQRQVTAQCSAEVAKLLGKPERYVMVSLECGVVMRFAASDAPCAYLELKSLGLPGDRTAEFSAALCRSVGEALAVEQGRIYIEFTAPEPRLWGWDGSTF